MNLTMTKVVAVLALLMLSTGLGLANTKYVLRVDGLSCPFCAYGLEKKLKKVDNVDSVSILMDKGEAVVTAEDGSTISERALRKAVKDAGFSLSSIKKVEPEKK